jgi:hypothetical protein
MTSLVEGVRDLVTPALIEDATTRTHESRTAVVDGLVFAISALLESLASRSADAHFMRQLASRAADTPADPNALLHLEIPRVPDSSGRATTTLDQWLVDQYGDRFVSVADRIGHRASIRTASAVWLLSIAAPLVLRYIGRLLRAGDIDVTTLAARLRHERSVFASLLEGSDERLRSPCNV